MRDPLFFQLSNPAKRDLLLLLEQRGPMSQVEILAELPSLPSQPSTCVLLRYLHRAGYVRKRRKGRHVLFYLWRPRIRAAFLKAAKLGLVRRAADGTH